jgi:hypothetical protein
MSFAGNDLMGVSAKPPRVTTFEKNCRFWRIWTPHSAMQFGTMVMEGGIVFLSSPPPRKETRAGLELFHVMCARHPQCPAFC